MLRKAFFSFVACAWILAGTTLPVSASPSTCVGSYFQDQRPVATNPKLNLSARELCHDYHAVWYSGVSRTPLWSAAFLTKGRILAGRNVPRTDNFREDTRLPSDWRAKLSDYRGSGYDRGHLVPSADMPTPKSDSESFLLSNIVPQDPNLNRNLWAAIESAVRAHANHRNVYTITGVVFAGQKIERLKGRVLIPTHIYKLVYEPERNVAAAYLVENAPRKRHREISLRELEQFAGVRFLPGARNVGLLKLPRPRY